MPRAFVPQLGNSLCCSCDLFRCIQRDYKPLEQPKVTLKHRRTSTAHFISQPKLTRLKTLRLQTICTLVPAVELYGYVHVER